MNRQELQAMIDSTIVPNKKKGITAESLRLVLSEMANATPQGSGNLEVINIYWPLDSEEGFSEDAIEELISAYKSEGLKINEDELRSYLKSILSKNAEAFKRIIETKDDKNILCFLVGAHLEDFIVDGLNSMYEETIGIKVYKSVCGGLRIPMACQWQAIDFTEEAEEKERLQDFQIVGLTYTNIIDLSLNPDGSFFVVRTDTEQTSTDLVKRIWLDELILGEVSEEHKSENAATVKAVKEGYYGPLVLCCEVNGVRLSYTSTVVEATEVAPNGYVVSIGVYMGDDSLGVGAYEDGSIIQSVFEV